MSAKRGRKSKPKSQCCIGKAQLGLLLDLCGAWLQASEWSRIKSESPCMAEEDVIEHFGHKTAAKVFLICARQLYQVVSDGGRVYSGQ